MIKVIAKAWDFLCWLDKQCMGAMLFNKTGKF